MSEADNEHRVRAFYEATIPGHRESLRGLQAPHVIYDLPLGMPIGCGHFEGFQDVFLAGGPGLGGRRQFLRPSGARNLPQQNHRDDADEGISQDQQTGEGEAANGTPSEGLDPRQAPGEQRS